MSVTIAYRHKPTDAEPFLTSELPRVWRNGPVAYAVICASGPGSAMYLSDWEAVLEKGQFSMLGKDGLGKLLKALQE